MLAGGIESIGPPLSDFGDVTGMLPAVLSRSISMAIKKNVTIECREALNAVATHR